MKKNAKDWPKRYTAKFIEPGLCGYADETVLIRKEALDRMAQSFVGKPVCILHQQVTPQNIETHAVGYVSRVEYRDFDGWYWAEMIIFDDDAKAKLDAGYNVSCAYLPTTWGNGGEWHNLQYDREILDGEYMHMALVDDPRYEDAKVFANSKSGNEKGRWITVKGTHIFIPEGKDQDAAVKEFFEGKTKSSLKKETQGAEEKVTPKEGEPYKPGTSIPDGWIIQKGKWKKIDQKKVDEINKLKDKVGKYEDKDVEEEPKKHPVRQMIDDALEALDRNERELTSWLKSDSVIKKEKVKELRDMSRKMRKHIDKLYKQLPVDNSKGSNKEKKPMFKLFQRKELENSKEILENSVVEIDGKEVLLSEVLEVYQNSKEQEEERENAKKVKMNAEDEIEVDGQKVKVKDLIECYKKNMSDDEEDEEKDNEKAEDEEEDEEEKENSKAFDELKRAALKANSAEDEEDYRPHVMMNSRLELGQMRYGTMNKAEGNK